ncbi:hypothetical protein [Kocuria sp. SM24M-10]|uniref:hypothetical protein n=1 Tax=Kocuria sp. SM24M-10 TaxID=1660349 RepID=UPI000A41DBA3|nr:hypothetical protein [Kocuria sp. SM24M-10]
MVLMIAVVMLVLAAVLLMVIVGHEARTGDAPAGAGATLITAAVAVAVIVLGTTGVGLIGLTWVLSVAGQG